ncbi:MAG: HEAT repeat domain-containing protein, partial [Candidatus Poribacteria bacterium]|nr:HEAT repeat domain-containing protein [Candidatus Poribacteria bacterium]
PGVYYRLKISSDDRLIPVYLDALKDPENRVKRLALSQISRHRFRDFVTIKPIADLLENAPDADTRAAAASSLGRFRSAESTKYLIKALRDDSARVVRTAIRALRSVKSEEAIEPLKQKLDDVSDKDWQVRLAAAEALNFITGKDWIQDSVEIPPRSRVCDEQITFEAYQGAIGYFY